MPAISERKKLENSLCLMEFLMCIESDSDSDLETDFLYFNSLLQKQYLAPRSNNFYQPLYVRQKLHQLPELSFWQLFRTNLTSFMSLLEMIHTSQVFQNKSQNPQRDPAVQLAVGLCLLDSNVNGSSIQRLQNLFSVGHGTIDLYTKKIIKAILPLYNQLLTWRTKEEWIENSQVMQEEGFPGCVSFVDGTTIPLSQKPLNNGNHYFDCKKRYDKLS
jgi:hypothetical protein